MAYSFLVETVRAIIMLYKTMEEIVRSPDGNTDFLDIVARRYISAIFVYNLCWQRSSNLDKSNKKNGFTPLTIYLHCVCVHLFVPVCVTGDGLAIQLKM